MKTLLAGVLALFSLAAQASGQSGTAEQVFRRFLAEYEKGVANRDLSYLARVIADDYVYTGPNGEMTNRDGALRHFKRQRENPDAKRISLRHDNVKVHVVGNMALSTHEWTAQTAPLNAADAEPITDRGRYTGVFEKRNHCWVVIAEHDSEKVYDDEWMVSGVLQAAREYHRLMERIQSGRSNVERKQSEDTAALASFLADEYTYTGPEGVFLNRDQAKEQYTTSEFVLRSAEYLEQKVRTIGNGSAIETGKIKYVGTNAGMPSGTTHRHTRTWAFYDGRWQITADHISPVAK